MPDLSDAFRMIRELQAEVRRLRTPIQLENSSITDGRMRFIGGLLRVDSGGRVEIEGTLEGGGTFIWTGTLTNNGPLVQNGTWELNGTGEIVGNTLLTGNLTVQGGGKITAGSVRIEDGKIYVGTMVLDPTNHSGMITMPNGSELLATDSNIELFSAGSTKNRISLRPGGVNIATLPEATSLAGLDWIARDAAGNLYRVPQGLGGPGGGPLDWPFPAELVTSEFGPRDGGFHEGIDFGTGIAGVEGTPIPAAAAGTVVEAVTLHSGWGNYVKVDHGGGIETLYAHMVNPPTVSVSQHVGRGQTLGGIGNTGNSFGNHLHFEVWVNGSTVNPRTMLP